MTILDGMYETLYYKTRQVGFRRIRLLAQQMFVPQIIIEQSVEWRKERVVNIIEFEETLVHLVRTSTCYICSRYRLPIKVIHAVRLI